MKLHPAHLIAIIGSTLTAVAGLNPAAVTSIMAVAGLGTYAPLVAPVIALITAGVAAAHAIKTPAAVAQVLLVGIMVSTALPLTGCSTVQGWLSKPASDAVISAVVDVAVATAEQKGVKAADINRVAKAALIADQGTSATLAAIGAVVNTEIAKLNLPPLDLAAATILEAAITDAVQQKIGNNPDLASAQAAVANLLGKVILTTGG